MESIIKKIGLLLVVVTLLTFSSIVIAIILSFGSGQSLQSGNVAVIPITGVISNSNQGGLFSDGFDSQFVRESVEKAAKDNSIKAIVFDINSPGGAPVASDEIGMAIRLANKTTVAWIRDVGASGAYWIASNTDYIIANRMSITGSVGVTASYIDFAGTLRRFNATYEEIAAGKYKELGNQFSELTPEERALLQKKIDLMHRFFLDEVQKNRNLTNSTVKTISTGEFYLGVEAKDLGLVDELGSYPEVEAYLNKTIGEEPVYVRYDKPKGLLQGLYGFKTSFLPQSKLEITT